MKGCAKDVTFQDPLVAEPIRGQEALRQHFSGLFAAFPDFRLTGKKIMVAGNEAFDLHQATGTNKGPIKTPDGKTIPATNKAFTFDAVTHMKFDESGLVKEFRVYGDSHGLMKQLGLTPP